MMGTEEVYIGSGGYMTRHSVMAKFTQDKVLKKLLVSTAHGGLKRMIIEHTTNDDYWGDNGVPHWRVGDPGNMLGQLLVEVREKIMSKKDEIVAVNRYW